MYMEEGIYATYTRGVHVTVNCDNHLTTYWYNPEIQRCERAVSVFDQRKKKQKT